METALIIPTLNAAQHWQALCDGIRKQSMQPDEVIVIDSSSSDETPMLARDAGFTVIRINRNDFTHGGTRQAAAHSQQD